MTINDSGRKKLIIGQAFEPKSPEGFNAQVLEFTAKLEPQDTAVKHSTWAKSLFPYIKPDTTIDCDVEVKPGKPDQEGNPRFNRKVTQIYVDGKPVNEQRKGDGFRPTEDSPEKRRSIERQAAVQIAFEHYESIFHERPPKGYPDLIDVTGTLKVAEQIYQWISAGTIPPDKLTTTPEKTQPVAQKGGIAPLTAKAVYDRMQQLLAESKDPDIKEAVKNKVMELGATGAGQWTMVQSLRPDKLAELDKWISEEVRYGNS